MLIMINLIFKLLLVYERKCISKINYFYRKGGADLRLCLQLFMPNNGRRL